LQKLTHTRHIDGAAQEYQLYENWIGSLQEAIGHGRGLLHPEGNPSSTVEKGQ
jgi:hypothetical protein